MSTLGPRPPITDAVISCSRLPYESSKAHNAFRAYCEMGMDRSMQKVADKFGKHMAQLQKWSSRWQWQLRLRTYDAEQYAIQRTADAEAALEQARKNQSRQTQLMEKLWTIQEKMALKFSEMMLFPVTEQKIVNSTDGMTTTIIMPGPWRFGDAVRMAQAVQNIGAFASGLTRRLVDPESGKAYGDDGQPSPTPTEIPKLIVEIRDTTAKAAQPASAKPIESDLPSNGGGSFEFRRN